MSKSSIKNLETWTAKAFWELVDREKIDFPFCSILKTEGKESTDDLVIRLIGSSLLHFAKYSYDDKKIAIQQGSDLIKCRKLYVLFEDNKYLVGNYEIRQKGKIPVCVRQISEGLLSDSVTVHNPSKLVH